MLFSSFHSSSFLEYILSIVVIAGIFGAISNPSAGLLNIFLDAIGLDFLTRQWMGDPHIGHTIAVYTVTVSLFVHVVKEYFSLTVWSAVRHDLNEQEAKEFFFQNFQVAFRDANMGSFLINSVIVTALALI